MPAILFAIATAIYSWRCPQLIQQNGSFKEFQDQGRCESNISTALLSLGYNEKRSNTIPFEYAINFYLDRFTSSGIPEDFQARLQYLMKAPLKDKALSEAYWFVRGYAESCDIGWRRLCASIYFLGFILVLVVVMQNIHYVLVA